jgi:hypothetical protein
MKRVAVLLVVLATTACGSLPDAGDSIVSLQLDLPASLALAMNHSLTLHAVALDLQGDPVATPIYWRTADTALVALDSVQGTITARVNTGTARIQARVGTLLSDIVNITLIPDTTASSLRGRP